MADMVRLSSTKRAGVEAVPGESSFIAARAGALPGRSEQGFPEKFLEEKSELLQAA